MNAFQPAPRPLPPSPKPRPRNSRQRLQHRHQQMHRAIARESGIKLVVNAVLAVTAVVTLVKLVPINAAQQDKLTSLRTEVASAQQRVDRLEASFERYFDPQQTRRVMQEQGNWLNPHQVQVIWVGRTPTDPSFAP